jgi:hypothetical protein
LFLQRVVALMAAAALSSAAEPPGGEAAARWTCTAFPPPPLQPVCFAVDAEPAKLAQAGIFSQYRLRPTRYRFPVPAGIYTVRLHYLQANGVKSKNSGRTTAIANGITVIDDDPVWLANMPQWGPPSTAIPADIAVRMKEATVPAEDGTIDLAFVHLSTADYWGIYGIEIIGPARTIRVRCGSREDFTDADGNRWEGDEQRLRPIPTSGEFMLAEHYSARGEWIRISDNLLRQMGVVTGLTPRLPQWRMICDHQGDVFFAASGIGCWRYDWSAGLVKRVDGGLYTAIPVGVGAGCIDTNPTGAGVYLMGTTGLEHTTYAVRSLDGVSFESIEGYPQQNGIDWVSVDWTATPHEVFVKLHHTAGSTALSVDGGRTYREAGDDHGNLAAILAAGDHVLLKCLRRDGAIMRSTDLAATWTEVAEVQLATPPVDTFMRRVGGALFLHDVAGDLYISRDAGLSWSAVEHAPAFRQAIQAGRSDQELLGFAEEAAYGSSDGGLTWTKISATVPGRRWGKQASNAWAYDPALDAFYYVSPDGGIFRYAR